MTLGTPKRGDDRWARRRLASLSAGRVSRTVGWCQTRLADPFAAVDRTSRRKSQSCDLSQAGAAVATIAMPNSSDCTHSPHNNSPPGQEVNCQHRRFNRVPTDSAIRGRGPQTTQSASESSAGIPPRCRFGLVWSLLSRLTRRPLESSGRQARDRRSRPRCKRVPSPARSQRPQEMEDERRGEQAQQDDRANGLCQRGLIEERTPRGLELPDDVGHPGHLIEPGARKWSRIVRSSRRRT